MKSLHKLFKAAHRWDKCIYTTVYFGAEVSHSRHCLIYLMYCLICLMYPNYVYFHIKHHNRDISFSLSLSNMTIYIN